MTNLNIEVATNGYILRINEEFDEQETLVFGYDSYSTDKDAFGALIYSIAENCGVMHDKFKNDNLKISWDLEGHKYIKLESNE